MISKPVLSICIPTNNRVEIMRETLHSIFKQRVNTDLFEVCISDNSKTDETRLLIEKEFNDIPNLVYNKSDCEGFLNSMEALKLGQGQLLKLHNDYSKFNLGALMRMIRIVETYKNTDSVIFFSMGNIRTNGIIEKENFNDFLNNISYWSTWSSAFAIWKTDFEQLLNTNIQVDHMFPHTTLLFNLTNKKKYIVDDRKYVTNIELKKKGGYNLIDNFVRIYLSMVNDLLQRKCIKINTYNKIEKAIIKFSAEWLNKVRFNSKYTFTFENRKTLITNQCGNEGWLLFKMYSWYYYFKYLIKSIL